MKTSVNSDSHYRKPVQPGRAGQHAGQYDYDVFRCSFFLYFFFSSLASDWSLTKGAFTLKTQMSLLLFYMNWCAVLYSIVMIFLSVGKVTAKLICYAFGSIHYSKLKKARFDFLNYFLIIGKRRSHAYSPQIHENT